MDFQALGTLFSRARRKVRQNMLFFESLSQIFATKWVHDVDMCSDLKVWLSLGTSDRFYASKVQIGEAPKITHEKPSFVTILTPKCPVVVPTVETTLIISSKVIYR
jgi:hypothetical protein